MKFEEATKEACKQPTFLTALSWIAGWLTKAVIVQPPQNTTMRERTPEDDEWETRFLICFRAVMEEYNGPGNPRKLGEQINGLSTVLEHRRERIEELQKADGDARP